jgi:hypothetical protein
VRLENLGSADADADTTRETSATQPNRLIILSSTQNVDNRSPRLACQIREKAGEYQLGESSMLSHESLVLALILRLPHSTF